MVKIWIIIISQTKFLFHDYKKHKESKYKEPEKYSVYNLKVHKKQLADSLYSIIKNKSDFFDMATLFSVYNPKNFGEMAPFDKNKNKDIIEALKNIKPDNFSSVFKSRDNKWSIVYFKEIIPEEINPYDKVKNRIKTVLIKENQEIYKKTTFDNLFLKYKVIINNNFFQYENE